MITIDKLRAVYREAIAKPQDPRVYVSKQLYELLRDSGQNMRAYVIVKPLPLKG